MPQLWNNRDNQLTGRHQNIEHSPHKLSGASLQVSLFEEFEDENPDDFGENRDAEDDKTDENDITIIVSACLPSTTEDAVVNYFENSKEICGDLQRLLEQPHRIVRKDHNSLYASFLRKDYHQTQLGSMFKDSTKRQLKTACALLGEIQ
ncbi:hypothetical protein OS493_005199 [Desmophyllum pertusum]|uniref:Uncharacterized protein n=1 Tax=Desmophyllum pertusum TaxID=174260 RepID=A0A9X0CTE2_9CNID|nr:hypothetical protein OS493_005199 [Desmophyllum pertusum]